MAYRMKARSHFFIFFSILWYLWLLFPKSFRKLLFLQQHLTKPLQLLHASHFLILQRHYHHMKVLIKLQYLVEVLLLHFGTCIAHPAVIIREEDLVDDNVVDIDVELGQLLNETLSFIHGEEFRNADCDKGSLGRVLHVFVYSLWVLPHLLHLAKDGIQGLV